MNNYGRNYPQQPNQPQNEPAYTEPMQSAPVQAVPAEPAYMAPPVPAEPACMAPPAPAKKKGNKLLTTFVIITFLLSAANAALIGLMYFTDNKVPTIEEQLEEIKIYNTHIQKIANETIEFGTFKVTETSDDAIYYECEIKNTSNRILDDVYVYYDIYDSNNNFIGSTYSFVPHINANSSVTINEAAYFANAKTIKVSSTYAVYADDIR